MVEQQHLTHKEQINLGSYYTKPKLVKIVYDLLQKYIADFSGYTIIDTSCGYGSFLDYNVVNKKIGADIDDIALNNVKTATNLIHHNSLLNIGRQSYGLSNNEKVIIVGNPPYNDTTSIIRNKIKTEQQIDNTIKTRDLGMSFLLSYSKLDADFICVLHPLSYLIKKTNFNVLYDFTKRYKLLDCEIISSQEFTDKVSSTFFPIIIALYCRGWMDYNFIENYNFNVNDKSFRLKDYVSISNFISKYPNQKYIKENDAVAKFYTMRDINALKRSKTFVKNTNSNTIFITKDKLEYYIYVDVFKKFISHIPYYFGNCDVMIDNSKFQQMKNYFINYKQDIVEQYFKELLGEHYV